MAADVFISHSHKDGDFARRLADILQRQGISALSDIDVAPGENWGSQLREALDNADAVVLVVSPAALSSPHVMSEVGAALASDKPIIPILPPHRRIPRSVPPPIGKLKVLRTDRLSDAEIAISLRDSFEHFASRRRIQ